MNQRTLLRRLLSPAGFGLVLIFFLLPFVTVSCGAGTDKVDATFTGMDMAVGGMPDVQSAETDAAAAEELGKLVLTEIDLEPLALLAACAVFAGMVVGILRRRRTRHASAAAAAVLAVALIVGALARVPGHVSEFLSDVGGEEEGVLEGISTATHIVYGAWLVVIGLIGLAAGNGIAFWRARGDEPAPTQTDVEEPGRLSLDELT
jgi:hypothetical protein